MKKLRKIVCLALTLCLLLLPVGCSGKLRTPYGFSVDIEHLLTWKEIDDARTYDVRIVPVGEGETIEDTSRRESYSLALLPEGDYDISVRAVGGGNGKRQSDWSEPVSFHKDYETGLLYSLIHSNTEYEVTKVGRAEGEFTIESYYRGKPVTSIASSAFRSATQITSVTVGENVRRIGDNAFLQCTGLKKAVVPDTVTSIGTSVFENCALLEEVTMPAALTEIPAYTFAYCASLKSYDFSNTVRVGQYAFLGCSSLEKAEFSDSLTSLGSYSFSEASGLRSVKTGSGLKTLASYSFFNCTSLEEVELQPANGDTFTLGSSSFRGCTSLTRFTIPEGTAAIGEYCFYGDEKLVDIGIPRSVIAVGKFAFARTKAYENEAQKGNYVFIDGWALGGNETILEELTEVTADFFPEGAKGIANEAFRCISDDGTRVVSAHNLRSVVLRNSIRSIGLYAFSDCTALETVSTDVNDRTTPPGLERIGDYAFYNCTALRSVFWGEDINLGIRSALKEIGSYAFYGCAALHQNAYQRTMLIPSSVTEIGTQAFTDSGVFNDVESGPVTAGGWLLGIKGGFDSDDPGSGFTSITLEPGTTAIADYAFYNEQTLETISGVEDVSIIGTGAFWGCYALTDLTLSSAVREIRPYTFYGCMYLTTIGGFSPRLTSIGEYAFAFCSYFVDNDLRGLPLESIKERTFYGCSSLMGIQLSDSITSIGDRAFYGCASLVEVDIPDSVTSIGKAAFAKCYNLTRVEMPSSLRTVGESAFRECPSLAAVDLPATTETVGDYAFYGDTSLRDVTLGESVGSIGNYAFTGTAIETITIPASVKSIGTGAFAVCTSLSGVTIPATVEYLGESVFLGSPYVTVYTDATERPAGWETIWNSGFRPAVWGCELSEEGYVLSVTVDTGTVSDPNAIWGLAGPTRKGYLFLGWSKVPDGLENLIDPDSLTGVEAGTKLYAVWTELPDVPEEPETPETPETEGMA